MSLSTLSPPERGARSARGPANSVRGVDRTKLLETLESLYDRSGGDIDKFRQGAVEALRTALASGRGEAQKALLAGGAGRACARALSAQFDDLLRVAFDMSARWLAPVERGQPLPTIVAVGGYGRGLLAPFSDIDLLFLVPDKPTPAIQRVIEALLYVLWDLKQKVGHATRTVAECLKQARADMTIRTTLVEARLITGDEALFETLLVRFDKEIVARTAPEFVAAKLAEREARVRRAGASRYLVEPNVKEGKGRPARSQHAVLDREIRLSRATCARPCRGGTVLAARVRDVPALRGIPVDGALPAALSHRPP